MKKILLSTLAFLLLLPAANVHAQAQAGCNFLGGAGSFKASFLCVFNIGKSSGIKFDQDPVQFILNLISFGLTLAAILAMILIMYAGVRYIISRGEEEQTTKAKKTLLYAILGLLLIGVSIIIVNVVIAALRGEDPKAAQQQAGKKEDKKNDNQDGGDQAGDQPGDKNPGRLIPAGNK